MTLTHAQQTVITGTGAVDCSIGQAGQVWFIGWSRTNSVSNRSCSVPAGTALFLPVIAEAGTTAGAGNPITPQELRQATTHDIDGASHLFARVDGVRIRHLSRFRAVTPFFYTRMLRNDILNLPEGTLISAIGDGYWLMISPLDPGVHHLRVAGTIHGDTREVSYTINVTAGQRHTAGCSCVCSAPEAPLWAIWPARSCARGPLATAMPDQVPGARLIGEHDQPAWH